MAYPFFSLAKSPRIVPIRFEAGGISLTVEGVPEHGIAATIWDADVLIWAASQIIQAKKSIAPSRLMVATPYEILRCTAWRRRSDYLALRAAWTGCNPLPSSTTLRQREQPNGAVACTASPGSTSGHVQLRGVPTASVSWFFAGVMDDTLVLTLDPTYFRLGALSAGCTGWCTSTAGGSRRDGDMHHLHLKSGTAARPSDFAIQVRHLARRCRATGCPTQWRHRVAGFSCPIRTTDPTCPQILLKNLWMV